MTILRIQHPVQDFAGWKAAFDRDPIGRPAGGVRSWRIQRRTDAPDQVVVDLAFDSTAAASAFRGRLEMLWQTPGALGVLGGAPTTDLLDVVEEVTG